jgi:hypothetical protein
MKNMRCIFASAIAIGLVAFTGKPAVATCLTQPNLRADGGPWYYRIDRPTRRKCWYQRTSSKVAPSATSSPPSSANAQALPASPSSASSDLSAWLSSISAAITSNGPGVAAQNAETHDPRSAEAARESSSRWRKRAARGVEDGAHNRRANVEQLRAKPIDPRPIIIATGLLTSTGAATAVECRPSRGGNQWAWRQIDNKKCWYAGEPGMDKSKLRWPANADPVREPPVEPQTVPSASEPEPRSTFRMVQAFPASDTDFDARWPSAKSESAPTSILAVREPPAVPQTAPSPSEPEPRSTFGMGLAFADSDTDFHARWAHASILAESDGVGTESQSLPLTPSLVGALIFVLFNPYTLAAWSFLSGKLRRLPSSRFARQRRVKLPSSAPPLKPAQPMPQPQYSRPPPMYIPRSARRERAA